ncbi:unnamed protein product, partial [Fusarium fujikuroi]
IKEEGLTLYTANPSKWATSLESSSVTVPISIVSLIATNPELRTSGLALLEIEEHGAVIVRPDGHVIWRSRAGLEDTTSEIERLQSKVSAATFILQGAFILISSTRQPSYVETECTKISTLSIFINGFLNFNQVALGRLVLDTANPGRNFCKTSKLHLNESDRSRIEFSNVYRLTNARSSSNFQLALTKLLQVLAKKSGSSVDRIETGRAVNYELLNVNDKLEKILKDEEVRKWVELCRRRTRVYIVLRSIVFGIIEGREY